MTENRCELMNVQTSAGTYGLGLNVAMQQGQAGDCLQLSSINSIQLCQPWYPQYQQSYTWGWGHTFVERESKVDKAFKIIKSLMDKKIIKDDISVKEFMEICEAISKEI